MCGICGILNLSRDRLPAEDLQAMSSVLGHRGPDDQGKLVSGPVAVGFRRLSILDLSRGHQPMCNEERDVWLAFNREIDNHAELRPGLQKRGDRLASNSDTDALLPQYEASG